MEVLRIEHLTKIYGKGENEVKALDNVSFTVEQGELVAIIGPSGSGKSTLLHMLGGVDKPTRGKMFDYMERIDGYLTVWKVFERDLFMRFPHIYGYI